jgi:GNAT superfamily N-acetyltransferase
VLGTELDSDELGRVDALAFPEGYQGQHDTRFSRHGVVVRADASTALVGYILAIPIIGHADTQPWFVDTVAVVPERHHEGIGGKLMAEVARWLDELGVTHVTAKPLIGVDEHRRTAWFERLGFEADDHQWVVATARLGKGTRSS